MATYVHRTGRGGDLWLVTITPGGLEVVVVVVVVVVVIVVVVVVHLALPAKPKHKCVFTP